MARTVSIRAISRKDRYTKSVVVNGKDVGCLTKMGYLWRANAPLIVWLQGYRAAAPTVFLTLKDARKAIDLRARELSGD